MINMCKVQNVTLSLATRPPYYLISHEFIINTHARILSRDVKLFEMEFFRFYKTDNHCDQQPSVRHVLKAIYIDQPFYSNRSTFSIKSMAEPVYWFSSGFVHFLNHCGNIEVNVQLRTVTFQRRSNWPVNISIPKRFGHCSPFGCWKKEKHFWMIKFQASISHTYTAVYGLFGSTEFS